MEIEFRTVLERDIDLLLMKNFSQKKDFIQKLFLDKINLEYKNDDIDILRICHSVTTNDGESDIEVILGVDNKRIALLIEDKIDAVAQADQAGRYMERGEKAINKGDYNCFYSFIVAPQKYLNHNAEAQKYPYKVSYEEIKKELTEPFDLALIDQALFEAKHGYCPIEDTKVTDFWNKLYDYIDEHYYGKFNVHGKKGEERGSKAQWVTFNSGKGTMIQIKADRGYVDLEIAGYADKFLKFSTANQELLDRKRLFLRMASKSLAIRKYIEPFDFTVAFEKQVDRVDTALREVIKLQELIKDLKF